MDDPIAFFITISTYGTWLPGDQRSWVEYHRGWQFPDAIREFEAAASMRDDAKILNSHQRVLVEQQIRQTCEYRNWICHAANCRTNHVHMVVSAFNESPRKVRADLKAWCTRRLKEDALPKSSRSWWAERGSIRWVFGEESLKRVIYYVTEQQD